MPLSVEVQTVHPSTLAAVRPFNSMNEAYKAIDQWMAARGRESAGHSREIYGDPTPDPADAETTIMHLLK